MSKRMRELFEDARRNGRKLFIPYVTAGYPTMKDTVPILLAAEAGGADIIEIGVPFTDPMADGATIQHANQIALEHGISVQGCFDIVREAREKEEKEASAKLAVSMERLNAAKDALAGRVQPFIADFVKSIDI